MSDHEPEAGAPEPRRNLFEPAPVIDHQGDPVVVTRRRGGTPLPLTLLLTAALGGAGYYGWSHPMEGAQQAGGPDAQQVQALAARVDALEKRTGAEMGEATAALSKRVDDLSGRLDTVSGKTDQLEAQSAKIAEIAAQKNPPAEPAPPPPDRTAQDVPGLMAQQEAVDKTKVGQPGSGAQPADVKAALDALDQRLSKLETASGAAAAGAAAGGTPPAAGTDQKPEVAAADVSSLSDRVAKLEQAAGQPDDAAKTTAAGAAALAALNDRLAKLEQASGQTAQQAEADQKAQQGDTATLAALNDRLAKLEQVAGQTAQQAEADQKAQQGDTATLATLNDRLAKLEQVAGQAQSQDAADQKAQATDLQTLAALNDRVAKLEQGAGVATGAAKDATRAIRLEAAAAALQAGQPLGELPGAPPALARFATAAPPTEAALRADFPRVADAARLVSQPDNANRSFLDRALARIQQSVVVRQGDHVVVGDPAAGVLARAQASVAAGDLKGAADTLGALTGQAADAVRPWVGQVRALVDARAALASMAAHG